MVERAKNAPGEWHTATPYLCVDGAGEAIEFYKTAFDAVELMRHADPDGKVRHAQFRIGDSMFMISDVFEGPPAMKSVRDGGSGVSIFLTVEDADAAAAQAIAAGATEFMPMADQEYGRSGGVTDPFGLVWWVTTPPKK